MGNEVTIVVRSLDETDLAAIDTKAQGLTRKQYTLPIKADDPINDAWRAKVNADIRATAKDALNIPVGADTAELRTETADALASLKSFAREEIPVNLADADTFKASVEGLLQETRAQVDASRPIEMPVRAENPIDTAWRAQVAVAVRDISSDALKLPMEPDTDELRAKLAVSLAELRDVAKAPVTLEPTDAAVFRAQVDERVKALNESVDVPLRIQNAQQAEVEAAGRMAGEEASQGMLGAIAAHPMGAAIAAGVTLGGPLVLGAMAGIADTGLIALAAKLQSGAPEIQKAWGALVDEAKSSMTDASAVMVQPIADGLDQIRGMLASEEPAFKAMFSAAAADVPILTDGIDSLVHNSLPGLSGMVQTSGPIMHGLSDIMGDLGSTINDVADDVSSRSQTIGSDLSGIGGVTQQLGDTVGELAKAGSDLTSIGLNPIEDFAAGLHVISMGVSGVTGFVRNYFDQVNKAGQADTDAAASTKVYGESIAQLLEEAKHITPIFQSATTNADQLQGDIAKLGDSSTTTKNKISLLEDAVSLLSDNGLEKADDQMSIFYKTIDSLDSSLKTASGHVLDTNGNLDLTSEKGRDVQGAIEDARNAMLGYAQSASDAGVPTVQANGHLEDMYRTLEKDLLPSFGNNKAALDNMLASMGLIPSQITTDVSAPGAVTSTDEMISLLQRIDQVPKGKSVTITSLTSTAMAQLQKLGITVKTLPDGKVSVSVTTAAAKRALDNFIAAESGRTIFVPIKGVADPATGKAILGPYHAAGGPVVNPIPHRAAGGPGDSLTWMNEMGPEAVILPTGSTVMPASNTQTMARSQTQPVHVTVSLNVGPGSTSGLATLLREMIRTGQLTLTANGQRVVSA